MKWATTRMRAVVLVALVAFVAMTAGGCTAEPEPEPESQATLDSRYCDAYLEPDAPGSSSGDSYLDGLRATAAVAPPELADDWRTYLSAHEDSLAASRAARKEPGLDAWWKADKVDQAVAMLGGRLPKGVDAQAFHEWRDRERATDTEAYRKADEAIFNDLATRCDITTEIRGGRPHRQAR